jgi:hypothetical protein
MDIYLPIAEISVNWAIAMAMAMAMAMAIAVATATPITIITRRRLQLSVSDSAITISVADIAAAIIEAATAAADLGVAVEAVGRTRRFQGTLARSRNCLQLKHRNAPQFYKDMLPDGAARAPSALAASCFSTRRHKSPQVKEINSDPDLRQLNFEFVFYIECELHDIETVEARVHQFGVGSKFALRLFPDNRLQFSFDIHGSQQSPVLQRAAEAR